MDNLHWPIYKNLEKEVIDLSFYIHFDDTQLENTPPYSLKVGDLLIRCCMAIESLIIEMTHRYDKEIRDSAENDRPIKKNESIPIGCRQRFLKKLLNLDKRSIRISCSSIFLKSDENVSFAPFAYRNNDIDDFITAYNAIKHDRNDKTVRKGNIRLLLRSLAALYILNVYYRNERRLIGIKWHEHVVSFGSEMFCIEIVDSLLDESEASGIDSVHLENSIYTRRYNLKKGLKDIGRLNGDGRSKAIEVLENTPEILEYLQNGGEITEAKVPVMFRELGKELVNKMQKMKTFSEKKSFLKQSAEFPGSNLFMAAIPIYLKQVFPTEKVEFSGNMDDITEQNIVQVCTIIGACERNIKLSIASQQQGVYPELNASSWNCDYIFDE